MTQYSFMWGCGSTGDQGNITLEKMMWQNMLLGNGNPEEGGVVYWTSSQIPPTFDTGVTFTNPVDGLLAPTNPSGSTVRIASGVGMVNGWFYFTDVNTDFDIAADLGNASATDLIVLERDSATATVRLARVKGAASTVATVTQNSTLWQVALAQVVLTAGGDFSSLVDVRKLCHGPLGSIVEIESIKLESTAPAFSFTNIPPLFSQLKISGFAKSDYSGDIDLMVGGINSFVGDNELQTILASGAVVTSEGLTQPSISISNVAASGGGVDSSSFSGIEILINGANRDDLYPIIRADVYTSAGSEKRMSTAYTLHQNLEKVESFSIISFFGDFVSGSELKLYGII